MTVVALAGPAPETSPVAVRAIAPGRDGARDLDRFVDFAWEIYRDLPCWVPPLRGEQRKMLTPAGNPFFRHSAAQLFLAERATPHGPRVVGRIAAIHFSHHVETWHDGVGFFGFFESVDDAAVASALLDAAAAWLRARGLVRMRGPMSFTINDECGILLDGFERLPVVLMTYNPPYYPALLEAWGLAKCQDLLAYRYDVPPETPARLAAVGALAARAGVTLRRVDLRRFDAEIDAIHRVHSAAWAENWGAVPLTREEVRHLAKMLLPLVDPELVLIAEHGGEPVGVCVTIPDVNQALWHLRDGRLLPFGWAKLLWQRRRIDAARVLIMGVVAEHRRHGVEAAMYAHTLEVGRRKGLRWGELSWVLESNLPMRRVAERLGAEAYKRYRIYERAI